MHVFFLRELRLHVILVIPVSSIFRLHALGVEAHMHSIHCFYIFSLTWGVLYAWSGVVLRSSFV